MVGFLERYELGDSVCGIISYAATYNEARGLASLYAQGSHRECGDIIIYDRMAHRGQPEMWNQAGRLLQRREA